MSSQNNWISVKERLPKDGATVLVHKIHQWRDTWTGVSISRYDSGAGFYDKGNLCVVTHWQPLPEPPEENSNETNI